MSEILLESRTQAWPLRLPAPPWLRPDVSFYALTLQNRPPMVDLFIEEAKKLIAGLQ